MWIWWVTSLIILIACFIFAYRMIVSSYQFLPTDKNKLYSGRIFPGFTSTWFKISDILSLKSKLQKIEENSSFYDIQISKVFQRLQALEEIQAHPAQPVSSQKAHEENSTDTEWKELYYEENELKEKLENELDAISQKLEYVENKLHSTEGNNSKLAALQSEYDARLNDLHSKDNDIDLLRRQLDAATCREKDLQQSLLLEVQMQKQYSRLQSELARLQSENQELKKLIIETGKTGNYRKANAGRANRDKRAIHQLKNETMIPTLAH